ncbi:MAG: HXXEE domain-containing protein [Alistipes onderdonkii]
MAGGALLPGWLLWSLPAMFLLHDAEEVLFLPPWLRRNRELLARRFPQLARRMLPHFDGISPCGLPPWLPKNWFCWWR